MELVSFPRKGRLLKEDEKPEKEPDAAFYDAHSADKVMGIKTIKLGFFATKREMGQLWTSIETEMDARQVLDSDIKGKGTLAAAQAKRLEAVIAGIEGVEYFKRKMRVIDGHQGYKERMCISLRSRCLSEWNKRRKSPGTPAPATIQGRPRQIAANSISTHSAIPTEQPIPSPMTRKRKLSDVTLGSQEISLGKNGVEDFVTYLPLHLVPVETSLRKLDLPNDETKARVQPEDLSLDLLKEFASRDCAIDSVVSVTCPELRRSITNDRKFQTAIHILLGRRSKLKFMFSDSELVRPQVPATLLCFNKQTPEPCGDYDSQLDELGQRLEGCTL